MADDFFAAFGEEVSGEAPVSTAEESAEETRYESSGQWAIWVVVFIALLLAMIFAW